LITFIFNYKITLVKMISVYSYKGCSALLLFIYYIFTHFHFVSCFRVFAYFSMWSGYTDSGDKFLFHSVNLHLIVNLLCQFFIFQLLSTSPLYELFRIFFLYRALLTYLTLLRVVHDCDNGHFHIVWHFTFRNSDITFQSVIIFRILNYSDTGHFR
jgi:hypothetical protein